MPMPRCIRGPPGEPPRFLGVPGLSPVAAPTELSVTINPGVLYAPFQENEH